MIDLPNSQFSRENNDKSSNILGTLFSVNPKTHITIFVLRLCYKSKMVSRWCQLESSSQRGTIDNDRT